MSEMTRAQKARAIRVLAELHADEVIPDLVTAREADRICRERYGLEESRFGRVAKDRLDCHPVNLAQIAAEVAKKEPRR